MWTKSGHIVCEGHEARDVASSSLAPRPFPLVIGYGNPLRADDGVGWEVAQQLAANLGDDVEIIRAHQLTPELAEPISRARLVVFVDARAGGEPGRVECRMVATASEDAAAFSHDVDPAALLALACLVYGASPPASVVSIAGADFGYGGGLSRAVKSAVPEAVVHVRTHIAEGKASCTS